MARREWIVTWEAPEATESGEAVKAEAGKWLVAGPDGGKELRFVELAGGLGTAFRLLDDDGVVMGRGRYFGAEGDETQAFGPLDDWGMPSYGCTSIEVFGKSGWVAL